MFWRMGTMVSAFLHLPILYIVHFLLLTPTVYSKNDGGVEMMMTSTMMSEEFWTEAEAEAETAGYGVVLSLPSQ
jgi:hypothetical protein